MELFKNRTLNSELIGSRLSLKSLNPQPMNSFEKLISYMEEKYKQRIQNLEHCAEEFKNSYKKDPALSVMRENEITEKFIDQRISELFHSTVLDENEKTITILQNELMQKKSELIKCEQQFHSLKSELEKYEDTFRQHSLREKNEHSANREDLRDLFEKERKKNEILEKETAVMRKELNKTREIFQENEKLQRYCEQLEDEREKTHTSFSSSSNLKTIMEAQKQAGYETMKEIQNKFKRKSKALKKKILDQKMIIESFETDQSYHDQKKAIQTPAKFNINDKDLKASYEKRESELIEKHTQQIYDLQAQYKNLLDAKIREIQDQLTSRDSRGFVSQEQYFDVCKQKNDLENELLQVKNTKRENNDYNDLKLKLEISEKKNSELENSLFILKTHQEINDLRTKAPCNEKFELEVANHTETKLKLKLSEQNLAELKNYLKEIEELNRKLKESLLLKESEIAKFKLSSQVNKLSYSKISKLKNYSSMLKSQLKNLKIYVNESVNVIMQEYALKLRDSTSRLSLIATHENKNLSKMLRNNSEAFDKLQDEVKNESVKMKLKSHLIIENAIKENNFKHDKEIEEMKNQLSKYKELFEKANNSLHIDSQSNMNLRSEIVELREEKDQFRKKLRLLEEKIETQTNNFKVQLKNKQIEIEILKKKISN